MWVNKMSQFKELWENSDIQIIWPRTGSPISVNAEVLEKFAKLVVKECLSICEDNGDVGLDGHHCADKILKRFGR